MRPRMSQPAVQLAAIALVLQLLAIAAVAQHTIATLAGAGGACSPAGVYFVNRDMKTRADPITLQATAAPSPLCPAGGVSGFVASTLRYWKDAVVCR